MPLTNSQWPCPVRNVPCGAPNALADQPGINLTAEGPDPFFVFPRYFPPQLYPDPPIPTPDECKEPTEELMEICTHKIPDPQPDPPGPGPVPGPGPATFANTEQTCPAVCGNGLVVHGTTLAGLFTAMSQADADAMALAYACDFAASLCAGAFQDIFNTEQTCTVTCPDLSTQSYTVPAGAIIGADVIQANGVAFQLACAVAQALCAGPLPAFYESTEQTCTVVCPDGRRITITVPAQSYLALTQADADAGAHAVACQLAALGCITTPPPLFPNTSQFCTSQCNGGQNQLIFFTDPGAFLAPTQAQADALALLFACAAVAQECLTGQPVGQPQVGNEAQTCQVSCAGGGSFTATVPVNTVYAASRAAANSIALSLACRQANQFVLCIGNGPPAKICLGIPFDFDLELSRIVDEPVFGINSGALPTGLSISADGEISGTPTTLGDFTFTVFVVDDLGHSASRTYTVSVVGVTTASLPAGVVTPSPGTPYSASLASSGIDAPKFWSLDSGSLPPGLVLTSGGSILGAPTVAGTYNFVVRITGE